MSTELVNTVKQVFADRKGTYLTAHYVSRKTGLRPKQVKWAVKYLEHRDLAKMARTPLSSNKRMVWKLE